MTIEWGSTPSRRLPVYLLLDCSAAMAGAKMQQLDAMVRMIYEILMSDPGAVETVWISIITFGSHAEMSNLVPIREFTPPRLLAGGGAALGAALHLLNQSLDRDLIPNQLTRKGDFRPLVFIALEGMPTDSWEAEAHLLQSRSRFRPFRIVGFTVGHDADMALLQQLAGEIHSLDAVTPDVLRACFLWWS